MRNIQDRYIHVYRFLIRKQKQNFLANVRLQRQMHAVVFVGKVYTGNRISTRSHEDLRALKPNEIFNDFAISYFKDIN